MKKAGTDIKDLKAVHAKVASIAAGASRPPRRTGRLAASERQSGTATQAILRAGGARVPYANAIHWGYKRRNIASQPWLTFAAHSTEPRWIQVYEDEVDALIETVAASTRGVA